MPRSDAARLRDIVEAACRIQNLINHMSRAAFESDDTVQRAVLFDLVIIGEAAKGIDPTIRARMLGVRWKAIGGMRDFVIHQYWGIDLEIVWRVAIDELPALLAAVNLELD